MNTKSPECPSLIRSPTHRQFHRSCLAKVLCPPVHRHAAVRSGACDVPASRRCEARMNPEPSLMFVDRDRQAIARTATCPRQGLRSHCRPIAQWAPNSMLISSELRKAPAAAMPRPALAKGQTQMASAWFCRCVTRTIITTASRHRGSIFADFVATTTPPRWHRLKIGKFVSARWTDVEFA